MIEFQEGRREETELGEGGSGLAYALPIVKRRKLVPKHPCVVKPSKAITSSVSGGKKGSTANLCRKFWDT